MLLPLLLQVSLALAEIPAFQPEAAAHPLSATAMPPGFVDLTEIPGLQFGIGYATPINFTGAILPGYGSPGAWLRKEAAASIQALLQKILPQGYGLIIYDAYRPARASAAMVTWARATGHSSWVEDGFIAEHSLHNTGAAIDLSLTINGQPVDMGSDWDAFGPSGFTANATGDALANRLRLKGWMQEAGWLPYSKEWWHFTWPMPDLPRLDVPYP